MQTYLSHFRLKTGKIFFFPATSPLCKQIFIIIEYTVTPHHHQYYTRVTTFDYRQNLNGRIAKSTSVTVNVLINVMRNLSVELYLLKKNHIIHYE